MGQNRILFTNLVYGKLYSDIFLNHHIRSLLDPTNIPAHKAQCEYLIFTDSETHEYMAKHPCITALNDIIPVSYIVFESPQGQPSPFGFNNRYQLLIEMFKSSVAEALKKNMLCSPMVADLVFAKSYVPMLFQRFDNGHDSVFVLPARTAFEAMRKDLEPVNYALEAKELWDLAYKNMHPLWVHCQWENTQFTRLPYTLIWNTGTGLFVRSFSITPICFIPQPEMLNATQVIDVEVPSMVKNPFWATDWVDCPVIGVEPLFCYYPPFRNERASVAKIKEWKKRGTHPSQGQWLTKQLSYPDRQTVDVKYDTLFNSNQTVLNILEEGIPEASCTSTEAGV